MGGLPVAITSNFTPPDAVNIRTFGDSITFGVGASSTANRWSSLLATELGLGEINRGISGSVLQNTTPVLTNNGRDRYISALVFPPYTDWIFILYGLNDLRYNGASFSVENYQTDLTEVVQGLIDAGFYNVRIVLGSPPYMDPSKYTSGAATPYNAGSTSKHEAYRNAVQAVANAKGTHFVDIYDAMLNGGAMSLLDPDGIHPNDAGHLFIKNQFLTVV